MTFAIIIDQQFAADNDMTLTQVACLSACMDLLHWSKTVTIDGIVWYQFSETKMCEDYPVLFSIPKRVYKNMLDLEKAGFIEVQKIGKDKYLRIMPKCQEWKKAKSRTESPKTDRYESENGLNNSPKTDSITNQLFNNNNYITNNISKEKEKESPKTDLKTLFRNSELTKLVNGDDYTQFIALFPELSEIGVDIVYYYHAVCDWSDSSNTKRTANGWKATIRNFIRSDKEKGKLHLANLEQMQQKQKEFAELQYFLNL